MTQEYLNRELRKEQNLNQMSVLFSVWDIKFIIYSDLKNVSFDGHLQDLCLE